MSTLKTVNLQNPASGIINGTLNADGTTTFGGVVNFDSAQTFPNAISSLTAGTGLLGGTITTTGTISLDTAYTDTLYLPLTGGTMTGNIVFAGTQIFPNAVSSVTAGTGLLGGTITTSGTIDLDTAYTDTLYLGLGGGTMTGDVTFSGTQTFPGVLPSTGGIMTGDITFSSTQTFPNTPTVVPTPPTSPGDPGSLGEVAFGTGFFYFHDGVQWLKVAGVPV